MGDREGHAPMNSVQQAFRLLDVVAAHEGGASAERLALEAELPLDEALRVLRALTKDGYLRRIEDGGFVLGDGLGADLGGDHAGLDLLNRVRPALVSLRDDLSAAAYLTFYEEGEIRIAEIVDGPQTPRVDLWVGFEDAGHATALGKCVLRELDDDARAEYLSRHTLADLTPRTITHREELVRQLESSFPAPAVMDREEYDLGTTCIAVPVYQGATIGSLGVSFRADRMYRTSQVRASLLSSADRVTRGLSLGS
ncbi:IclR family transcriptional regulator C-terminal domain-containing protein [Streptomyces sp. JH34]|uniref:IclR family transcriptional regulator n=1 Tax=unclassified Streptomyces TaxID=2593676 RepID=UPI0023F9C8AC|nr:IclR family transcriptional regulator C-terminal domain-containing protein [Streptomyces sp. JH34]MDF6019871.1 helix-turn-helix domain-containing protein [Streptomyces sp. JH34]